MKRFFTLATVVATTGMLLGAGFVGAAGAASASVAVSHPQPGGEIIRAPGNSGLPTRQAGPPRLVWRGSGSGSGPPSAG